MNKNSSRDNFFSQKKFRLHTFQIFECGDRGVTWVSTILELANNSEMKFSDLSNTSNQNSGYPSSRAVPHLHFWKVWNLAVFVQFLHSLKIGRRNWSKMTTVVITRETFCIINVRIKTWCYVPLDVIEHPNCSLALNLK